MQKEEWFSQVRSLILSQPEVKTTTGGRIKEVNKSLSPNYVGGCFCKTFPLTLTDSATPEPWKYDELAATLQHEIQRMAPSPDDVVTLISVEQTGHGDDRSLEVKAYIIPDPE